MNAALVIDTQPIVAWIGREEGWEAFRPYFESTGTRRIINPLTLFEVKSVLLRENMPSVDHPPLLAWLKALCETMEVSEQVALRAAEIRFKYIQQDRGTKEKANLSMADAVTIALAEGLNCPVLSGERGLRQVTEVPILPDRELLRKKDKQ